MKHGSVQSALVCVLLILVGTQRTHAQVIHWPMAFDLARQRAASINCLNNLHFIFWAARGWANDNGDAFPQNFQMFSNYLDSPSYLFCAADLSRPAVTNWNNFDWSCIAYQWSPQPNWFNPDAVCCRCRIHEHLTFVSGYVMQSNTFKAGWPAIIAAPMG